jgi:hypothetical protein
VRLDAPTLRSWCRTKKLRLLLFGYESSPSLPALVPLPLVTSIQTLTTKPLTTSK